MKINTLKKTRRYIFTISFVSIICLFLISIIPWITIAENETPKQDLHFSYEMMKLSDNPQIQDLSAKLNRINILFWTILVVGLISLIFIIYYAFLKKSLFTPLLLIISTSVTFIISVLIVYFLIIFFRSIKDIDNCSVSMIQSNFAYAYILLIIITILSIYSAISTITISVYSIKQLKSLTLHKKEKTDKINQKETPKKLDKKEIEIPTKKPITDEASMASNMVTIKSEMEEWLEKDTQSIDKKVFEKEQLKTETDKEKITEPPSNNKTFDAKSERPEKDNQKIETLSKEEKSSFEQFQHNNSKEKLDEIDEERPMKPFKNHEKQNNTIESKITKIDELKPEIIFQTEKIFLEKQGDTIKKIFNVRCPQCNNIFSCEKERDTQKITCPKCGKEGTTEKEF